jgi:hypothetical protein
MATDAPGRRCVHLVDVPVDLYHRSQQHTDDLLRELVLIAGMAGIDGADGHWQARHALRVEAAPVLDRARESGDAQVTLTYGVDGDLVASAREWEALLDQLDELCRSGTLLTMADPEVALFSRWFCAEIVHQLRDGQPPCPWPQYRRQQAGQTEGPYVS